MRPTKLKSLSRRTPIPGHLEEGKRPVRHHRTPLASKQTHQPLVTLTENSELAHSIRTKTHRKSISLVADIPPESLFGKSHRRVISDVERRKTPNPRHRHSTSTQVAPVTTTAVDHSRHHSLLLDFDSLETEYLDEDLANCSTKKIISKPTPAHTQTSDLKLVTYVKRHCREHGKPPVSSLDFYQMGPVLGRGAFSVVYSAVHKLTRVPVAIKSIEKSTISDLKRGRTLGLEVEIMRCAVHPSLLQLFELIETGTHLHLVMEYASGGSLLSLIQTQGKMNEKAAKQVIASVTSGLKALHEKGIVHRDVKLDNILIGGNGAKLGDFGVSKCVKPGEYLNDIIGTPSYLSPEIILSKAYNGQAADMWSLGVCLYGLLCGTLPFKGFNLTTLHKSIVAGHYLLPSELSWGARDVISGLLCKDPDMRLTAAALLRHTWLKDAKVPLPAQIPGPDSEIVAESTRFGLNPEQVQHSVTARDLTLAYGVYATLRSVM